MKIKKLSIYTLGRAVLLLYILFSYITYTDYLPSSLYSISLYLMVGLGLISLFTQPVIQNKYIKWYVLFLGISFVLALFSPSDWWPTFYQMIVMVFIAIALDQFVRSIQDLKLIFYAYSFSSTLMFLMLLSSNMLHVDQRLGTTVMGNANSFALVFMVAILMSLWLILYDDNKVLRVLMIVSVILNFYALLLSGGRKFIIAPIIFLYFLLLRKTDKKGRKHIMLYTGIVVIAVVLLYFLIHENAELYKTVGYRMDYLINMITGKGDIGSSNEIRARLRDSAMREGLNSPLFGHGFDSFKVYGRDYLNYYAYAHNNWAELWYDMGIIGIGVYYWFYVKLFKLFYNINATHESIANLGMGILLTTFVFEYGCVTYYSFPNQILLCLIAIAYKITINEDSGYEQI